MLKKNLLFILLISIFLAAFLARAEEKPPHERMVLVKGGTYQMGDVFGDGKKDEKPAHEVHVSDFYLDKYEVTQKEYQKVMEDNPSYSKGCDECPVESVTWYQAKAYCENLEKRLPTEAEWEYAARSGGKKEKYAGTNDKIDDYVWHKGNSQGKIHPIGKKKPNGLGIFDMSGNAAEWTADWYDENYYRQSPRDNPQGAVSSEVKIVRGGAWIDTVDYSRSTARIGVNQKAKIHRLGFRCAKSK